MVRRWTLALVAGLLPGLVVAQETKTSGSAPPKQERKASGQKTPPTAKPATAQPSPAPAAKPATEGPAAPAAAAPPSGSPPALAGQKERVSYAIGMDIGGQFRKQSMDLDVALLVQGLKDAFSGGTTLLTEQEARTAMNELRTQMMQKEQEARRVAGEKNQKEGDAFLAQNKTKEGVVTLESGLQYKVLTAGTGPKPTLEDTVVCNYRGTLLDGTEFDSSYKRGEPATFPVKGLIKGWTEALQLMPTGSKWQLFIPSQLAYGLRGPGAIGPNATLLFELELLSIKPKS